MYTYLLSTHPIASLCFKTIQQTMTPSTMFPMALRTRPDCTPLPSEPAQPRHCWPFVLTAPPAPSAEHTGTFLLQPPELIPTCSPHIFSPGDSNVTPLPPPEASVVPQHQEAKGPSHLVLSWALACSWLLADNHSPPLCSHPLGRS